MRKPSYLNLTMHTIVMIFLVFFFRFEYPPDLHQYSGYYDDQYGYYSDYNGHRWDPHIQQWVQQTAGIVIGPGPKWAGFNPYKPSVLFVGHRQTAQAQIRRHNCLIRVSSVCIQYALLNLEKYHPKPLQLNGLFQLIKLGNYIRHKWVNFINSLS